MFRFNSLISVFILLLQVYTFCSELQPNFEYDEAENIPYSKTRCSIHLDQNEFPRVCKVDGTNSICEEFAYSQKNNKNFIYIKDETKVHVSCGRVQSLIFNNKIQNSNAMELKCEIKKPFDVKCETINHEALLRKTERKENNCPKDIFEIGFTSSIEFPFFPFIEICFDETLKKTLYAKYEVKKGRHVGDKFENPTNFGPKYINSGNFVIQDLYKIENQKKIINSLLGLKDDAEVYINENQQLTKGHLAPKGSFIYNYQKAGTFYFLNTDFQWKSINEENWSTMEQNERKCVNEVAKFKTLEIYVGTYGRAELRHVSTDLLNELKMQLNDKKTNKPIEPALYVPAVFWKVLYLPDKSEGIAVLTFNNPYLQDEAEALKEITCETIPYNQQPPCLRLSSDDQATKNPRAGLTYFCRVDDKLKEKISVLPKYDNVNLLTY